MLPLSGGSADVLIVMSNSNKPRKISDFVGGTELCCCSLLDNLKECKHNASKNFLKWFHNIRVKA